MSSNTEDIKKEKLDLLRSNYADLNNAVEESHKITWVLTSIFIPVIFAAIAYLMKEGQNYPTKLVALASVGILLLLAFWIFLIRVLRIYNKKRFEQLREIESFFKKNYFQTEGPGFSLFHLYRKEPKAYFYKGTIAFAILLGLILLIYTWLHPSIKI